MTMKVAVLGGAGAMGSLYGGLLARAGANVTLVDVSRQAVDAINAHGLRITDGTNVTQSITTRATTDPAQVGVADLVIVQVKGMHTESAIRDALPMIGQRTAVLTLQNGWGNADRIASVVGRDRVLAGTTLHSVTLLEPGHIHHAGHGPTIIGELNGAMSERLQAIAQLLEQAGFDVHVSDDIVKVIWSKLSLNVCALPACALLRFYSGQLIEHEGTLNLMRALLNEVVSVAHAQNVKLDFDEHWEAITAQLKKAATVRASMLQDVEQRRPTEIDTINGAIVEAGRRLNIPTPYNDAMVWLVKSLEETF